MSVGNVRYSTRAKVDLLSIGRYTVQQWGTEQADRYLGELKDCCYLLAKMPGLGRNCDEIRPGLRRVEQNKHVIFFREQPSGILVVRILHQRMLPWLQFDMT